PYKAAILPLQKNLSEKADEVYRKLAKKFSVTYDVTGSIGKRYRRQDEIGTPWCITYDFDTEETGNVTVRNRDTMEQITLKMEEVASYIEERLDF
ncbi:MAG: glycine--tRNA ligase, partial [Clostridia bacterium]|nr:glycine--tRNA ligase [Clostridia bacterium]